MMNRGEQSTHKRPGDPTVHGAGIVLQRGAAVEEDDRKFSWDQVNQEFGALRENAKAWKHELDERAVWDVALSDGLGQ